MKTLTAAALAAVVATATYGGGIDRSGQGISTLFETGELAEFTFGYVSPDVSGYVSVAPGITSGSAAGSYGLFSFGYKRALNDKFDLGLVIDQPFGANITYPTGTGYPLAGSFAKLSSTAITGLARYHFNERFSLHGGLRLQTMEGTAAVIPAANYTLDAQAKLGVGYVLGAAYEIPDIALRAVLTYNSEISHDVDSSESPIPGDSSFKLVTPQSVNLDFQTGIAANTLLMASVRWVQWSKFDITPPGYQTITTGPLVAYEDDRVGYTLGIGRKFNDQWSGSATIGYEKTIGGYSSNLSPTDGYLSFALGAQYTMDNMKISGGLRYIKIGDADTRLQSSPSIVDGSFRDNSGVAVGVKVSYTF